MGPVSGGGPGGLKVNGLLLLRRRPEVWGSQWWGRGRSPPGEQQQQVRQTGRYRIFTGTTHSEKHTWWFYAETRLRAVRLSPEGRRES